MWALFVYYLGDVAIITRNLSNGEFHKMRIKGITGSSIQKTPRNDNNEELFVKVIGDINKVKILRKD